MDRRTLLKIGLASLLSGCGGRGGKSTLSGDARPNIVLIVMDTVRRDHLSTYGYARETAPFLASILGESTQFTEAYSTSSWTFPAHASVFTGLYPTSHGGRWGNLFIGRDLRTLPEILQDEGYTTLGIAENGLIGASFGYDRGWDQLINPGIVIEGDETASVRLTRELLENTGSSPFFLFLNLLEPHLPYSNAGPFQNYFLSDPTYENWVQPLFLKRVVNELEYPTQKQRRHLTEHYDAEVRFVDSLVERIAEELKNIRAWDDTLFVVLSDHGEGLGEHDHYDHQFYLYENLTRVPLIIRWPGKFSTGANVNARVSLVDLFPTMLAAAQIDPAEYPSQGHNLLDTFPDSSRPIITENYLHQGFRQSVRHGLDLPDTVRTLFSSPNMKKRFGRGFKSMLIDNKKMIRGDDGTFELYDLAVDPGETKNLADSPEHRSSLARLERELDDSLNSFRALRDGDSVSSDLTETAFEALNALGYL